MCCRCVRFYLQMIGDAALADERDGICFLGRILVELVEDQRVERVHAVFCGCGAGRGILVGGYQAGPFLSEIPRRERVIGRSEEHTSELQSLMRISYAVFCLKKKKKSTRLYRPLITTDNSTPSNI